MTTENLRECNHGNSAPIKAIEALPPSQAGPERHQCAVCAYAEGYKAGLAKAASSAYVAFKVDATSSPL